MQEEEVAYRPGQVLAGKYKVERVLGVGGFGAVLAARHMQLEERVAIKVLLPHAAKNQAAAERFLREARAAVRIRSEHVAKVTDVGTLEDGVPYMVMEYLDGTDLSTLVKSRGGQLIPDVTEWIIQACEAIAEAHNMGIIHRDLKPANLFLTHKVDGAPCVKVLDFGISKMQNETGDKGMTKTSDVMGSPFYMSPEQMRSTRSVDVRSDIWALGTILFELLAGAPPFDAETMTALVVSIMQEPPRDLAAYRTDVPPALRDAIMRCLEKDPSRRFADVAELVRALAPFARARAQVAVSRVHVILGKPAPSGIRGAVSSDFPPNAGPTAVGMPTPTAPGSVSQGDISGSAISGDTRHSPAPTRPGTLVSGDVSAGAFAPSGGSMTQANGPMSSALYQSGNVAATASAPSQSWGGTYTGTKKAASRLPVFVGGAALFIVVAAAGGFFYVKSRGTDDRGSSALVVDKANGEKDRSAGSGKAGADKKDDEAEDKPGIAPAQPEQTTPPVVTATPTVTPAPTADPTEKPRPGVRPGPARPSKPTAEPTPVQTPPPNPTTPPTPTPTQTAPKPPPGPFDTPD